MEAIDTADSSAAIVCTARGQVVSVSDASDRPLRGLTLYGKTTQNGTPTPDAPVPLESAGSSGSIGATLAGKNLLYYPYRQKTKTHNGVTFTDNGDGSITVNGTATGGTATHDLYMSYDSKLMLEIGKSYTLTGCPAGHNGNVYLNFQDTTYHQSAADKGDGITFTPRYDRWYGWVAVKEGVTVNNLTFYPMLRYADTSAEYEPYTKQTLTALTPNGLPGIPVSSGGNYTDESGQAWICDEVDFARGVYVQRIYTKAFDGTENWGIYYNKMFRWSLPFASLATNGVAHGCCSHYPTYSHWETFGNRSGDGYFAHDTTPTVVDIVDNINGNGDIAAFKAFLAAQYGAGIPVTVQYVLETPIETPLTAEELATYAALHTNKPDTTLTNDAGAEMALSYVADTKLYIDGKFNELAAAIVNNT